MSFFRYLLTLAASIPLGAQGWITSFAGAEWIFPAHGRLALEAPLGQGYSLAGDARGNVYLADAGNRMVLRFTAGGTIEIFAGNGIAGYSGDEGDARNAALASPSGVAVDSAGNVYVADSDNHCIRKVDARGIITTYAGSGASGFAGDGGPARLAKLSFPSGLAIGPGGSLYVIDGGNARIRVISADGVIRTVAGNGVSGFSRDGVNALQASIAPQQGLAVDQTGRLYFSEPANHVVRTIDAHATLRTVAGTGQAAEPVEGGALTTPINSPAGLALDAQGNLYVTTGSRVMRVANGRLTAFAGDGEYDMRGDGRQAVTASLYSPYAIAFDARGNLHIADERCSCIRAVNPSGIINRVAGNGGFGRVPDQTPATQAFLIEPLGIAFDAVGNLLVASRAIAQLGAISPTGAYSSIAGAAVGCCANREPAKTAPLDSPTSVAVDSRGRIFLSEIGSNLIYMIENGVISIYAGTRYQRGFSGDNGPATQARLNRPTGIALDASGNLYVADRENRRVRVINREGVIRTFAGDGQNRYFGDGGPAVLASFRKPYALAVTPNGHLLIADIEDNRVRLVDSEGRIRTFAGNGRMESTGDGGPATQAGLSEPSGLAADGAGNVYIVETAGARVRRVDPTGRIQTIAGTGVQGLSGDGGLSPEATLRSPQLGLALSRQGDLYIADTGNNRIRVVHANPPRISLDQGSLAITVRAGEVSLPRSVQVRSDRPGAYAEILASGGNWLRTSPGRIVTPQQLQVSVDARQLSPGAYRGAIEIHSPVAVPPSLSIPVTVVVEEAAPPKLSVSAQALVFELPSGGGPAAQTITVANSGGGTVAFAVHIREGNGGAWLTGAPLEGTAAYGSAATVQFTATAERLEPGTYSAEVVIRELSAVIEATVQEVTLPATLTVRERAQPRILLSHSGLSFTAVAGGGRPLPQWIGVLNEGDGAMSWSARAVTLSGGDWLRLGQAGGRVDRPLLDVSLLEVSADPRGLAPGEYYGRVDINAASENSPQFATVVLRVLAEGTNPGPEVHPAALIFTGTRSATPGSQTVFVSNPLARSIGFVSSRLTFDGGNWFTHSPGTAAALPNEPARIVVQPNYENLTPGVRRGVVTLLFEDGATRNVNVLTVVAADAAAGSKEQDRSLAGCPSPDLRLEFTSLREGFVAIAGQPTTIEVRAVDDCGNPLTPQTAPNAVVLAEFSTPESAVRLTHLGNGVWAGTWRPRSAVQEPVVVTALALFREGGSIRAAASQLRGTVQAGGRTPIVLSGSLRHAATFETSVPVTPGQLISVLGDNLADREARVEELPLPREIDNTEVLLGGRPLALLFTSERQINAQLPYDLPVNSKHQILVRRGPTLSVPEPFVVAPAQPGIFTKNQQGFGQGVILKGDSEVLAEPDTPAERGEEVRILCTGLGAVEPPLEAGQPAPSPAPRVLAPVEVAIGGVPAQVKFAGLTPGLAGRYEVVVVVPLDAPSGDAVPAVITAAGRSSPPATMAVK